MRLRRIIHAALAAVLFALCAPASLASAHASHGTHVPVYAYFYQWFEKGSWDRAKQDFPLAGRYSSDDPHVLRNQIAQARWAGIDGFLTSWKSTPVLNRRLRLLLQMAALTHFDVGVVYEALDFERNPLPIAKVSADMSELVARWGEQMHSAFGKPVIIWTGTNEYTHAQVKAVHAMLAGRALLLAASKNVADYEGIADVVDGEAYYWSSANPRSPGTATKLDAVAAAVHAHHGIWIAPAAPGFDGRPLGHTRVIDRANGATFAASLAIANASSPDVIGAISWNEWSENTYIEAGRRYGRQDLKELRSFINTRDAKNQVSVSTPSSIGQSGWTGLRAAAILMALTSVAIAILVSVSKCPPHSGVQGSATNPRAALDVAHPTPEPNAASECDSSRTKCARHAFGGQEMSGDVRTK